MRSGLLFIPLSSIAASCLVLASPALSLGRGQGFRPCPYAFSQLEQGMKPFDGTGRVMQVLSEHFESEDHPAMAVVLESKMGNRVYVHLGPVWYLERQGLEIFPGDSVEVKGRYRTMQSGELQVIAHEAIKGDHVLVLRDSDGRPVW
jgi:hypothetical protein